MKPFANIYEMWLFITNELADKANDVSVLVDYGCFVRKFQWHWNGNIWDCRYFKG